MVFHIDGKENQGCNLQEMFPWGVLTILCQAGGWVKCLTLVFRGVKFGTKRIICTLRAPYSMPCKLRKVYEWAWLVALTDGFHFQTEKTSNFCL